MLLALSNQIRDIDIYSAHTLGIPMTDLMERSGKAVERVVRRRVPASSRVVILAGSGNNGGDGYALASLICSDYECVVFDIFSKGQSTVEGQHFISSYLEQGGVIRSFGFTEEELAEIKTADCIVDAVFGTGFVGEMPERLGDLIAAVNSSTSAYKIAIDVPLGVNADDGSISEAYACSVGVTVALSFIKPGLVSYPARSFVGEIVYDDLGLPLDKLVENFSFRFRMIDLSLAKKLLPKRNENGSKGSFGKLLMVAGSKKYRGAAHLAMEAALRGGVGLVNYYGDPDLCSELSSRFPETIYTVREDTHDARYVTALADTHTAALVGSGSSVTEELSSLVRELLVTKGSPIVLDADAINVMAEKREEFLPLLKASERTVILTPHPLEFARLSKNTVSGIQSERIKKALEFASEYGCILVLKGAGTIVTNGELVYINSTGSSALSKAGSGDVLAGFIAAVVASGKCPIEAAALAVYFHGLAADALKDELSVYGVTPSDLPRAIARSIASVSGENT